MVVYTCLKCSKEFVKKYAYDMHMSRKFPCVQATANDNQLQKLQQTIDDQQKTIKELIQTVKEYQDKVTELHNVINEKNTELLAMGQSRGTHEKIKINNNQGGNVNVNNVNNVNVNVINMTTFGKENKNDLNKRELLTVLNAGDSCFLSMIRHIHANDRLPQYQNVCVTNLRATGAYIFENNEWNYSDYDNILYLLMTARMSDLDELIRDKELAKEIRNISRVKAVVDNYWDDTDKFVKQNKHRIINLLYNYTKNNMNGQRLLQAAA
jgi:hypothetical protein